MSESSLSKKNRVFSQVSEPTYTLYKAKKEAANGVALVICPGGGFRDVWFDREGADFAMWLAEKGITSLVLKYRTFNSDANNFPAPKKYSTVCAYFNPFSFVRLQFISTGWCQKDKFYIRKI